MPAPVESINSKFSNIKTIHGLAKLILETEDKTVIAELAKAITSLH